MCRLIVKEEGKIICLNWREERGEEGKDWMDCCYIFAVMKDYNVMFMKTTILFFALACALCVSCNAKKGKGKVIGGADGATSINVSDEEKRADHDTVTYELPECRLVSTDSLVSASDTAVAMETARKVYWENVRVVDLVVTNPTDVPLSFGRSWRLQVWDGEKWGYPELRVGGIVWEDDLFSVDKAPLRYCFRIPVGEYYLLPEGKYRLAKAFWLGERKMVLSADFEIKREVSR